MKKLNEVIKAWEICFSDDRTADCTGCPYADEDGEAACFNHDRVDALHYLKEYQNKEMFYNQAIDHCLEMINEQEDRVTVYLAEMNKNDPLTWDELKLMEDKPVWLEYVADEDNDLDNPDDRYSMWVIVYDWHGKNKQILNVISAEGDLDFYEETQGIEWQAYRKERE